MTREEVLAVIEKHEKLDFKELKVSYLILKPNAARHYKVIVNEIEKQQYTIIGQYAIRDYETLNMALHVEQPESMKYIIPISRMYNDFYGNYGVLLLIGKSISLMRTSAFRWFRLSRTSEQDLSSRTLHMLLTQQNWEEKTYIKGWLSSIKMASKLWTNTLKEKELSWCFTSMKFILLMRVLPHLSKKCG